MYRKYAYRVPVVKSVRATPAAVAFLTLDTLFGEDMTQDQETRIYADFYGLGAPMVFSAQAVVLVEGVSDQLALQALAERRGRDLDAEGVSIVPMGGATNIRKALTVFGPQGFDVKLAGLCDAGERATSGALSNWPASART
jgi:hypothetical protein